MSQLQFLKQLGEGATASVHRAYYKCPKKKRFFIYAVKMFRINSVSFHYLNCVVKRTGPNSKRNSDFAENEPPRDYKAAHASDRPKVHDSGHGLRVKL